MREKLEILLKYITETEKNENCLYKLNIPEEFSPAEDGDSATAGNLNAAFLTVLSGRSHPLYSHASEYLNAFDNHSSWQKTARFYKDGLKLIQNEISEQCRLDEVFRRELTDICSWVSNPEAREKRKETIEKIWKVFFPEGTAIFNNKDERINLLREKRRINITRLNPSPVTDPANELLFTSNILITVPSDTEGIDKLPVSSSLKDMLKQVVLEEQIYWYDHPVPIGTDPEHNEVLYGLEGLDRAVEFEKNHGAASKDAKLTCLLSVSVTHEGLQKMAKEYLEDELKKEKNIKNLDVFVFTETDTLMMIKEVLIPAAEEYGIKGHNLLYKIVGVDGEYGRHYSFLKAIAAFWKVFIAPETRGTFKIDLDQVFPQKEMVEQAGASAFEHLRTPLWGAEGSDSDGNAVELGMIAGALVNQEDIEDSLFTPDIPFPPGEVKGDELIFFSKLPQALSTEAEMMTRYTDDGIDGENSCIHRIHVTGGTNGILIDSLRRHRPFTPTFIGRAEDQAYILSALFKGSGRNLRYVHKDGLIMRHDKEVFAGEAIKAAAVGKLVGDYIRTLLFSYYCRALPWSFEAIKKTIDPFTGCFATKIPLTIVYLRFALKAASLFSADNDINNRQRLEFIKTGSRRLHETIRKLNKEPNPLIEQYRREKEGWDVFYDILDIVEKNIKKGDKFAIDLQKKAESLISDCKINFERV